ncbi:hypothetical protein [Streptomyces longhuiensis]|uniref:hypothetical protein n=1 Tax=Streptomyces longhuiensis TaxID=2880933 RepID=UPI001D0A391D|nr:hypothetical protein [Streptomyces longhuiensis]UDM05500.1 hypothetical protein LGI35_45435 [Streptomyces longhuiensis]
MGGPRRWLLERQEEILRDNLTVSSALVGMAQRDPPRHDQHHPDAFWRAAVMSP